MNIQIVHVDELRNLFFKRHAAEQVLDAIFGRKAGILIGQFG